MAKNKGLTIEQVIILVAIIAGAVIFMKIVNYFFDFSLWTGLNVPYCDNMCELGRMG